LRPDFRRVCMIKEAVSPLEPRYEDLAGDGFGRKARRLFLATRPKFLTASILPVLVGTAWGATVAGGLELGVALLALLATALVHCASNVINDVTKEPATRVSATPGAQPDSSNPGLGEPAPTGRTEPARLGTQSHV